MLTLSQGRDATSAFKSDAVLPCAAAPSIILDEGHRLSHSAHTFFRAVRVFLSGLVDSSAFQEVSLGREVSIIFTSSGPLICQWEANNGEQRETARAKLQTLGQLAQSSAAETWLRVLANRVIVNVS
jgi:hypothetical protein